VNDVIGLACTGCAYTAYFLNASNLSVIGQTNTTNPLYDVDIQPGAYTPLFTGYSGANSSAISINVSWSSGVIGSTPGNMSVVSYYNLGNLGSSDNVLAVSCSLDSTYIVFGENASFTIINTTKIIRDVIFNYTSAVWGVRASDDSNYVVIGTNDGTIDVYSRMCGTCPNGEYLNGNQCILCALNITGCSACENATFCYSCFLGYYVNVTTSNFSSVCVQC
jgi:WD40 repeat protein